MMASKGSEYLTRLRNEVDRSLASFLGRSSFVLPVAARRHGLGSRAANQSERGAARVGADPGGEATFPDSERKARELAKEIKSLIAEDIRRGIGFGG